LYRRKRQALYAGLGSGKTAIVLHTLEKLFSRNKIKRALVVAPIAVCKGVWRQETEKWEKIQHLRFATVFGGKQQREKGLQEEADIYLINYENIVWMLNLPNAPKFDALVLDESTMVQGYSSTRFKGKSKRRNPKWTEDNDELMWLPRKVGLKHVVDKFEYVYTISGTPKPGEYLGLWSQIYCLDNGAALGKNITAFRSKYYYQYGPSHYQISLRGRDEEKEIKRKIAPLVCRISDEEIAAVIPKLAQPQDHLITLPNRARRLYNELENDFFAEIEDTQITVENVAVASGKLQQVCQGAIYDDYREVKKIHDEKIEVLDALITGLGGSNCLIIYSYKHDLSRLQNYRRAPVLRSTLSDAKFIKLQDEWNSGKHPIIYGHPKSMGHGLNLQGGGHHIIFFGLTWSLDKYQQTIGRLRRSGQENEYVFVHRIACRNTLETEIMIPRLAARSESQRQFLDYFAKWRQNR
jgi:hypothetical protein